MNKKVSTIFAMAALMGGVFSGSAYAQSLITSAVADGDIAGKTVMLSQGGQFLGVVDDASGNPSAVIKAESSIEKEKALNYTWKVTKVATNAFQPYENMYVFANAVTGDTLAFEGATVFFPKKNASGDMEYAIDKHYAFAFASVPTGTTFPASYVAATAQLYDAAAATQTPAVTSILDLSGSQPSLVSSAPLSTILLKKLDLINVPASELNEAYNGKGFNLDAKKVNGVTAEVTDNLFGEEDRIWAFEVSINTVNPADRATDGAGNFIGYKLRNTTTHDGELIIPKGMYFFVNYSGSTETSIKANNIDWLSATLITVSPTDAGEATDTDRKAGKGFKLTKVSGSDFIYENNTSIPEGDDVSIHNACFTIQSNYQANANYPYAISLEKFYCQESQQYAGDTDQVSKAGMWLGVESYENIRQNVCTMNGTLGHFFRLNDSSVLDGITLLKETKTPSIYAIKFVDGRSIHDNLIDKYLTVGSANTSFQFEAKGAAIAETDFPAFQWVITGAKQDGGNKYSLVTFTNRETNESFTAKLFPEGEGRYSMAVEAINGNNALTSMFVTPYSVDNNTYTVEVPEKEDGTVDSNISIDTDVIITLEEVKDVDRYAGFLNIDNESIRTLAFARDKNDTSNKLYAGVYEDNGTYYLNKNDEFVTDYEAAQWQLIKSENPQTISRVFVYNNTASKSVDDVPNGDKVSAYTYSLRYIEEGTEIDEYLDNATRTLDNASIVKNAPKFIIKENVDGSVSLIEYNSSNIFKNAKVAPYNATQAVEVYYDGDEFKYLPDWSARPSVGVSNIYDSSTDEWNIKTYLDPQKVEISWPATEGHVTLKSELGNYINMNSDRDAIVVNENDGDAYYLYVTDKDAVVPSFYITKGVAAENGERMFMFNPKDSVGYYVAEGDYDRKYEWAEDRTKVLFKSGIINEGRDTLTLTVKGEAYKKVAKESDNNDANIWGGLHHFKFQIVETGEDDGYYYIRQINSENKVNDEIANYLSNLNDKLTWSNKAEALKFTVEGVAAPTANEGVSATEVKIIATDGAVNVKNAAGKNVVISTILGQIVANEVLTSDNATISVPAGIAIVSVDGEEAVKVSVR